MLAVFLALLGVPAFLAAGYVAAEPGELEVRLIAGVIVVVSFAAVAWSVWREPFVLAKASAVVALFATAPAALVALSGEAVPWALLLTASWLVCSLLVMRRPPGFSNPHELLDSRSGVFEQEGVHFTVNVLPCDTRGRLRLAVHAENWWTGRRTLDLALPDSRASGPFSVRQTARWLLSWLLLSGCATTLEQVATHPWYEARVGGTRVTTPISAQEALAVATSVEERRLAMAQLFGGDPPGAPQHPLEVMALPGDAYDEVHPMSAGLFVSGLPPVLLLRGFGATGDAASGGSTQTHELGHAFLHQRLGSRVPKWLDEGLAEWVSTLSFSDDQFMLGKVPLRSLQSARSGGRVSFDGLLEWGTRPLNQAELVELYAAGWAWATWLLSAAPDQLTRFLVALRSSTDQEAAWREAFGGAPPTEQTLNTFLRFGQVVTIKLPRSQLHLPAPVTRALSRAEALVRVASLEGLSVVDRERRRARGLAHVQQALALDPTVEFGRLTEQVLRGVPVEQELLGAAGVPLEERVVVLPPPSRPECRDIEPSSTLEASMPLRPTQWLPAEVDPWPAGTEGEAFEHRLPLTNGTVKVLAAAMHRRGTFDDLGAVADDAQLRYPFVELLLEAEGGHCVIGSWRTEFGVTATVASTSTWVSPERELALVLVGFDVGKERRWVVLGTDGRRMWFAFDAGGMTQAITPWAELRSRKDGRVQVVFGSDVWTLVGEHFTR